MRYLLSLLLFLSVTFSQGVNDKNFKEILNSRFGKKIILPTDFGVTESIDSSVRENVLQFFL